MIRRERPTDIYVPHPCDNHSDHYATYCFVRAAIEQLDSEGYDRARKIEVHTYLVHRGDWPSPKGDYPQETLAPPYALAHTDTKWRTLELPPDAAELKRRAIKQYKTQTAIERGFLMSFARGNEVFGTIPDRKITHITRRKITIDGNPEDWSGILPAVVDPVGDYVVAGFSKGGDVRTIYLSSDDRYLFLRVDCVRNLSKSVTYNLNFRGLSDPETSNRYTISIRPKSHAKPARTIWAYRNNVLEVAVPLAKLNFDEDVFLRVHTTLTKLTVDNTGWRGFEFKQKAESGKQGMGSG